MVLDVGAYGLGHAQFLNDGVKTFCIGVTAMWNAIHDKEINLFRPSQLVEIFYFLSNPVGLGGMGRANNDKALRDL